MWAELKDRHAGETGMVIGNGPSLKDIPLALLKRYPGFGSNRIYLFKRFTPRYYAAINPLVIEQSIPEINALESCKFIRAELADLVPGSIPLNSLPVPLFSKDPARGVYEGFTVTYVCLQLAFYLGLATVLLVGVDHRYTFDGQPNEERVAVGPDPNHFDPGYFSNGVRWHNPDLARSEQAYRMAKTNYTAAGRRIINLTPGTALNVFDKGDWREWC